jgi:hypothetical protein
MDRKGHYLKPPAKVTAPRVLICCTVKPVVERSVTHNHIITRTFGSADVNVSYYRRGKWGKLHEYQTDTPEATRELIFALALEGCTNWVICPIASDVLTLTKWWEYVESMGIVWKDRVSKRSAALTLHRTPDNCVLSTLVVRGVPDIIGYSHKGKYFRWVSGEQYFPDGPTHKNAGRSSGAHAGSVEPVSDRTGEGQSIATARQWSDAFRRLVTWWRATARTPFGCTTGQLAMGLLRTYSPPKLLCTHNDSDARSLERAAAFGGRASVWYVGNVGHGDGRENVWNDGEGDRVPRRIDGPVTHIDVRSMYPFLMRERTFPVKFLTYNENTTPKQLLELAESHGVIARVTIRTTSAEFPYRRDNLVWYPVGTFLTTLTGPELMQVSRHGEILKVHATSVYKMGRPFEEFAARIIEERYAARALGDDVREQLAKMIGNSLAGKLAQRRGGWERATSEDQPGVWGEDYTLNVETQRMTRTRRIAGLAWRWSDDARGDGPYTFAFAYLTAYGRVMMREVREAFRSDSVMSQDTDGIWVLDNAFRGSRLIGSLVGESPGQLSKKATAHNARWYGPRHYYTDGHWTLAGFHRPAISGDTLTVIDTFDTSVWASRTQSAPSTLHSVERRSILSLDLSGGIVQPDGFVQPRHVRGK